MADYEKSLKLGIDGAKAAQLARQEIKSALEELDNDMKSITKGKISILLRRQEEYVSLRGTTALEQMGAAIRGREVRKYQALVAINPSVTDSPKKELAEWQQNRAGFPCKLIWQGSEIVAYDRESIEQAFAKMLEDPITGEKLQELINLPEVPTGEK